MNVFIGLIAAMLSLGTPLIIAAAGETVSERSGILNIGLEGMLLASAFAGFATASETGSPWLGFLAAIAVGIAIALVSAELILKRQADQVVVGTGVNLLALGVTGVAFVSMFGKTGQLVSVATIPTFGGKLSIDFVMLVTPLVVVAAWWLLYRTRWGLAVRACGEAPHAAEAAGHNPLRLRMQAMLFGGATAGIAGAYLTLAQTGSFAENMTEGRGFVVIAAVTFGRWTAKGSALACLLIAFAYGLKYAINAMRLPVAPQLFDALPYLLALAVLCGAGRGASAPASLALPYKPRT
ncbi:MAG: ABC transporter permease [Fimbriimonadales bacterium]